MKTALFLSTLILLLSACTPQLAAAPTSTSTPVPTLIPTATQTLTQTPQPSPTPYTFQPTIPLIPDSAMTPATNPPVFLRTEVVSIEYSETSADHLINAEIFKAYRWVEGLEGKNIYFKDQAHFIQEMVKFLRSHPELVVKQQQSPDNSSILTYMVKVNEKNTSVLFSFKNGDMAYAEPNMADEETKIGEVAIPVTGLTPEFVYNSTDGHWYLFAVSKSGEPNLWFKTTGATYSNQYLQWQTLTEYEGIYSEKYPPAENSLMSVRLKDQSTDMEIEMNYGQTNDMPFVVEEFTDIGKNYFYDLFMESFRVKYNTSSSNPLDIATFKILVNEGLIKVPVYYIDEISGKKKVGLYNPKNGFSVTLTFDESLPLSSTRRSSSVRAGYYITMNKQGRLILVKEGGRTIFIDDYYREVVPGKRSSAFLTGGKVWGLINRVIKQTALVTRSDFFDKDGLVDNPDRIKSIEDIDQVYYDRFRSKFDPFSTYPYVITRFTGFK